ncbi:MAG: hypothetical protein JW763_07000 [candidate division Zixibacteria bacterium]|nr:hypothetical protein [candidate division Zixibacteria bacterium]
MQSLAYLRGRRLWVVPDFTVWGLENDAEVFYLGVENVESEGRLLFGSSTIGGAEQQVVFADLVDWRGNHLPESINSPRVLIRPRSVHGAFVLGEESDHGFRIARDPSAIGPVTVDLFVFEMGW